MVKKASGLVILALTLTGARSASASDHTVASGDSLWSISLRYGCSLDDLKRQNRLSSNMIRPGDRLALPKSCTKVAAEPAGADETPAPLTEITATPQPAAAPAPAAAPKKIESALVRYRVSRGDTLIGLARRFDTSIDAIQGQNGLPDHIIKIGEVLDIPAHSRQVTRPGEAPFELKKVRILAGQSQGGASSGHLAKGTELPPNAAYHRRRPENAWGTLHMVEHIQQIAKLVKARHPKVHALAVGDMSSKKGGKLRRHASHQSGRDVDLGFYFTKKPDGYPSTFITATAGNLDFEATWTMLKAFADTADEDAGVHMMFLNYDVQKIIYDWARERGVAKSVLSWIFQYPRGKYVREGLIRHEPGHMAHVHVRFKCAPKDKGCH